MAQSAGEASTVHVHRRITASSNSQILEEILRGRLDTGTGLASEPVQRRQTATSDSFGVERKPTGTSDDSFKRMLKTALFNSIVQPPHAGSEALMSMASMDLGGPEGAPGALTSQDLGLDGGGDDVSDDESTDFIVLEKELRGFISSTGQADADTEPSMPTKSSGCYLTAPLDGIPEFGRLSLDTDGPKAVASQATRPCHMRDLQSGGNHCEITTKQGGNCAARSPCQQSLPPCTAGPQLADLQHNIEPGAAVSGHCVGGIHVDTSGECGNWGPATSTGMSRCSLPGEGAFAHVGAADGAHNYLNPQPGSVPESQEEHSPLMSEMLAQYGGQCTVGANGNAPGLIHSRVLGTKSSGELLQFQSPEDCPMGESTSMHPDQWPRLQQAGCECVGVCQPMEHAGPHVSDAPGYPQFLHLDSRCHQDHVCSGIPLQTASVIATRHLDAGVAGHHECHPQQTILDSTVVRAPPARKPLAAVTFGTTHGLDEATRDGSLATQKAPSLLSRRLGEPLQGDLRAAQAEKSTCGDLTCAQDQGGCLGHVPTAQLPSMQCSSGKLCTTDSDDGTEVSARKVKRKNTKGDKIKVESCERAEEGVAASRPADGAMGVEVVMGNWSAMAPVIKQAQEGEVPTALPDLPPGNGYYEEILKTMDVEMRLKKAEDKWREHDAGIKVLQGKISSGELGPKEGQEAVRKLYNRREAAASRSRREAELFQQVQQKRYLEQMESWLRQRLSLQVDSEVQTSPGVRRTTSTGTHVADRNEAAVGIDRSKAAGGTHRLSSADPEQQKAEVNIMHP